MAEIRAAELGSREPGARQRRAGVVIGILEGLGLASCLFGWSFEHLRRLNAKYDGQLAQHIKAGAVDATFERTDISSIYFGVMCESLLRQPSLMTKLPKIPGEDLSNIHHERSPA
jgi:hypothetical protein